MLMSGVLQASLAGLSADSSGNLLQSRLWLSTIAILPFVVAVVVYDVQQAESEKTLLLKKVSDAIKAVCGSL